MSNYHWVCFDCREAVRRPGSETNVRCPACGKSCKNIGYKLRVRPKSEPKLWQELADLYALSGKHYLAQKKAGNVRRLHDLQHEIQRLQQLDANDGRLSLLKRLKAELAALEKQHEELLAAGMYYQQGQLPPRRVVGQDQAQ